jgi:AcrR family transcriptional regulator
MGASTKTRESAEQRRDEVLDAATHEFAVHGYQGASTAAIAERAGISQPYIYALFPNKRALFLAAHARMVENLRTTFIEAARGIDDPDARLRAMGLAYLPLVEGNRDQLLLQMQSHAAAGDPEIGREVAAGFKGLVEDVRRASGVSDEQVAQFFACGMLINVTTALGLPEIAAPALQWTAVPS